MELYPFIYNMECAPLAVTLGCIPSTVTTEIKQNDEQYSFLMLKLLLLITK